MLARVDRLVPLALIVAVSFVAALAVAVATGAADPFDQAVIGLVRADGLNPLLWPLRGVTELGSTLAVTLVAIAALCAGILFGRARLGAAAALTVALTSVANSLLKTGFGRARPDLLDPIVVEHGYSFPSGHALLSMAAYGVVAVMIWRSPIAPWARRVTVALLVLLVLAVGMSRVWLGVHYPTDVLAGWTLGGLVVLVFARLSRVVTSPAAAAAVADPAVPRSGPPAPG